MGAPAGPTLEARSLHRSFRVGDRETQALAGVSLTLHVGVLLQSGNLVEHLSVVENVAFAQHLAGARRGGTPSSCSTPSAWRPAWAGLVRAEGGPAAAG